MAGSGSSSFAVGVGIPMPATFHRTSPLRPNGFANTGLVTGWIERAKMSAADRSRDKGTLWSSGG
jgi:hypothetical protein